MLEGYSIVVITNEDDGLHERAKDKALSWLQAMEEEENGYMDRDFRNRKWHRSNDYNPEEWWKLTISPKHGENNHAVIYVLYEDEVVGMCQFNEYHSDYDNKSRYWSVYFVYIEEAHRGKGVGKALLKRVKAFAKDDGVDAVALSVFNRNPAAMKLYESLGFIPYRTFMACDI